MVSRRSALTGLLVWLCAVAVALVAWAQDDPATAGATTSGSAKTWSGDAPTIEQYLRTAEIADLRDISTGVTASQRAELAPGGRVDAFA